MGYFKSPYVIKEVQTLVSDITNDAPQLTFNTVYKHSSGKFYWYMNSRGYLHILKPAGVREYESQRVLYWTLQDKRICKDGHLEPTDYGRYSSKEAVLLDLSSGGFKV